MAEDEMTEASLVFGMTHERWQAGDIYISALRTLGFDPETVMWVFDEKQRVFTLAFVTTMVDRVGSKAIYEILFKAYDKAVTPRDFDPWIVSLFSPQTFFAREFVTLLDMKMTATPSGHVQIIGEVALGIGDYTAHREWIYVLRGSTKSQSKHQVRDWQAFEQNVMRLAA